MSAKEIERRRLALSLSKKRLAELAGLDETAVGRALNGHTDPLTSTMRKLDAALAAEEKKALAHLLRLKAQAERAEVAA